MGVGLRELWRCRRMVLPVYLANLAIALVAVGPLYVTLHRLTAHRPAAEALVSRWDLEVLVELLGDHPELLSQLRGVLLLLPISYLLLSQALLGGVLGSLASKARPTLRHFGAEALGNLPGLLGVLAWACVPYGVSLGLVVMALVANQGSSWWVLVASAGPGLVLLLLTDLALDFARVDTVLVEKSSALGRLLRGFWATRRSPGRALALHLGFGLLSLAPLAMLLSLPDSLDAGSTWAVALAFGLRQLLVLARVGFRVASLGGHMALLASITGAQGRA